MPNDNVYNVELTAQIIYYEMQLCFVYTFNKTYFQIQIIYWK